MLEIESKKKICQTIKKKFDLAGSENEQTREMLKRQRASQG
jgi:hypothetical protein